MRFLQHNWHWKLLALSLAIMVHVYVRKQQDVLRTTMMLPVTVSPPEGQRVVEPPSGSRQVRVNLEGPAEIVRQIDTEEVRLRFDTSWVRPGARTLVPVSVELPEKYRDRVL